MYDRSSSSCSPFLQGEARIFTVGSVKPFKGFTKLYVLSSLTTSPSCVQADYLLGCGVMRRYGLISFQPFGNFCFITAGSVSDGTITTSSPSFQFPGVATEWLSVSCSESITRRISSKLRPALCG